MLNLDKLHLDSQEVISFVNITITFKFKVLNIKCVPCFYLLVSLFEILK